MNVCVAPGLTLERVIHYAEDDPSWVEEARRGSVQENGEDVEITWIRTVGDRNVRLTIGGYNRGKWFALPLDNDPPSYECKVEYSGGVDPRDVARALRAAGYAGMNPSRPTPLEGWAGLIRYGPDRTAHPGRHHQLVGHGCVINFHHDLEALGSENWYSRMLLMHCRR